MELIDTIADRGAVTLARRCHAHLHRLFRWSVGRGIIDASPMVDLPKPGTEVRRKRVLSDDELVLAWNAAQQVGWPMGSAIQLLMLTAARREEIGALQWSEIDRTRNEIRLEGERTKNGEPHTIPLSSCRAVADRCRAARCRQHVCVHHHRRIRPSQAGRVPRRASTSSCLSAPRRKPGNAAMIPTRSICTDGASMT